MSRRAADLGISTRVNAVAANMPLVFETRRLHPEYDISQELGLAMRALLDYAAHRKSFTSPGMFTKQMDIDGNTMPETVQALFLPLAEAKTTADVNAIFQGWSDAVDAELNGMSALMGERRTKEQMLADKLAAAGQIPAFALARKIKEEGGFDRAVMLQLLGQETVTRLRELGLMAKRNAEGVNPLTRMLEPDARKLGGSPQEVAENLLKWSVFSGLKKPPNSGRIKRFRRW